jgi:hypothetical protein
MTCPWSKAASSCPSSPPASRRARLTVCKKLSWPHSSGPRVGPYVALCASGCIRFACRTCSTLLTGPKQLPHAWHPAAKPAMAARIVWYRIVIFLARPLLTCIRTVPTTTEERVSLDGMKTLGKPRWPKQGAKRWRSNKSKVCERVFSLSQCGEEREPTYGARNALPAYSWAFRRTPLRLICAVRLFVFVMQEQQTAEWTDGYIAGREEPWGQGRTLWRRCITPPPEILAALRTWANLLGSEATLTMVTDL